MRRLWRALIRFLAGESGLSKVDYAILAGLVVVIVLTAYFTIGSIYFR
ncbi:MAG: hypothetical protein K2R98_00660 [Gemmataceae bacterium]|nr:hypothetical protein [Gemmataceae bacterium]